MALYELGRDERYQVVSLHTTVAAGYGRISHHGVRTELLERQAMAVGVPLNVIELPGESVTNEEYEALMTRAMLAYGDGGISTVAFGDIFLQDLRDYREKNLAKVGMRAVFPLWQRDTRELIGSFIELGFKVRLACIEQDALDRSFAGRAIDEAFVRDLPGDVDPCGENGEFHTFVWDGPTFSVPVPVEVGEVVLRDVRYFADLLPAGGGRPDPRAS